MLKTFQLANNRACECPAEQGDIFIYASPTDQEKAEILSRWHIDEHTISSALDPDELGRVELEDDHLAVIVKKPKKYTVNDNFVFKTSSIGLFLYQKQLVIILREDDINWEGRIFHRLNSVRNVFLRVIYDCVVHFEEHLKVIRRVSDELESEINQAVTNKDLLHMFKLTKGLVYYLDAINSNSKVAERLKMYGTKMGFDQDMNDLIDDLIIESSQCYQQADSYLDVLSSMTDSLASIINNNLNIRLKRLTVVSIAIMTPTFVVSLFSMNVPLPLPHDIISFWIVVALATASVIGLLLVGYLKKL